MTLKKVRLYQDVDGPLNAWSADKVWPTKVEGEATASNGTFRIVWSPEMLAELFALDVELVWATTWEKEAQTSLAPLIGWEAGKTARYLSPVPGTYPWHMYSSIEWKQPAVMLDQKDSPSPFIWIDDDLTPEIVQWAALQGGLAIWVHPNKGITPENIELMKQYIEVMQYEDEDA